MRGTLCVIATLILGCCASNPILYGLLPIYQPDNMVYTAHVIAIDVFNSTVSSVMEVNTTFYRDTIMGSAFDIENQIYYIINNPFEDDYRTVTSYISAIDMNTKEFIFKQERFGRKHQPTYWGVDIGSDGYIHYFSANQFNPKELLSYYAVDYRVWSPKIRKTIKVLEHIAMIEYGGSVAWAEDERAMISLNGFNRVTDIDVLSQAIYSIPKYNNVFTQSGIKWNKKTNKGYMIQWRAPQSGIVKDLVIAEYTKETNDYPIVCNITLPTKYLSYEVFNNANDLSALSEEHNLYSFVANGYKVNSNDIAKVAIVTVDLDSCETYFAEIPTTESSFFLAPEYSS